MPDGASSTAAVKLADEVSLANAAVAGLALTSGSSGVSLAAAVEVAGEAAGVAADEATVEAAGEASLTVGVVGLASASAGASFVAALDGGAVVVAIAVVAGSTSATVFGATSPVFFCQIPANKKRNYSGILFRQF